MSKNIFYNTSYFKFFRRYIKPIEMEKELINLIDSKNENNNYPKTEGNQVQKEKKINLEIFYPKNSIDLIKKIVDLFIEFDEDKSNSFDRFEFYKMFNLNKIPIKMDEIIYLFNFNAHKKTISFSELINLSFNPDFDLRYQKVITKIRPRLEIGIICPNDFSGMLSHLCEFGKLSETEKGRKKNSKTKKIEKNNLNQINNNKIYITSKTKEAIDSKKNANNIEKKTVKKVSFSKKEENPKKISTKIIYQRNKNNNLMDSFTDTKIFKKMNKLKEENEEMINYYKTLMDITKKKVTRNELLFKNFNYRNKYEISKRKLAKSIDTLYKINPNINNTYITYNPIKQKFINLNTGNDYDFNYIKNNYKSKRLKNNKTESFSQYKPILIKINENREKNNIFLKNNITTTS